MRFYDPMIFMWLGLRDFCDDGDGQSTKVMRESKQEGDGTVIKH